MAINNKDVVFRSGSGVPTLINAPSGSISFDESSCKMYVSTDSAVIGINAGKADTLSTSRTINGTNFNGSANITTANWGTARNLTIGNTNKSVNGSTNVSWSLNEIGASQGWSQSKISSASGGSWARIATTDLNINNNNGVFVVTGQASGFHSTVVLLAGVAFTSSISKQSLIQLNYADYGVPNIMQARLVTSTNQVGGYTYLDIYIGAQVANTSNQISVSFFGQGWKDASTVSSYPNATITTGFIESKKIAFSESSIVGTKIDTALRLNNTSAIGSATQPVYFSASGVPVATTYTLAKSVPSDAVFTDTTYSNMTAATASAAGTAGLVPAPAAGKQASFLRGDGTWASPSFTQAAQITTAGAYPVMLGYNTDTTTVTSTTINKGKMTYDPSTMKLDNVIIDGGVVPQS